MLSVSRNTLAYMIEYEYMLIIGIMYKTQKSFYLHVPFNIYLSRNTYMFLVEIRKIRFKDVNLL